MNFLNFFVSFRKWFQGKPSVSCVKYDVALAVHGDDADEVFLDAVDRLAAGQTVLFVTKGPRGTVPAAHDDGESSRAVLVNSGQGESVGAVLVGPC